MLKRLLATSVLLIPACLVAYGQQSYFQTILEGTGDERFSGVVENSDSTLSIVGSSDTYGAGGLLDGIYLHADYLGDIIDIKTVGGTGTNDQFEDIVSDGGSGYLAVGATDDGNSNGSGYIVGLDANGDVLWSKSAYGGPLGLFAWFNSIKPDAAGAGFTICEGFNFFQQGDLGMYVIDNTGNILDQKYFGDNSTSEIPIDITTTPTSDGNFLVYGVTNFGSNPDNWVLAKIDTAGSGSVLWSSYSPHAGSPGSPGELIYDALEVADGYLFCGQADFSGSIDMFLMKTDFNGNQMWTKAYSGPVFERALRLSQNTAGNIMIGGWGSSPGLGGNDVILLEVDGNGNLLWGMAYGGSGDDRSRNFIQTMDGGYAIVGTTESFGAANQDGYLIKTDSAGASGCNETIFSPNVIDTTFNVQAFTGGLSEFEIETLLAHTASTTPVTYSVECTNCDIVAGFTFTLTDSLSVDFTDMSTGGPAVAWEWDFGDGSPLDLNQNPSHTYGTPGTYTVCLTVWDALGCEHDTCITTTGVNIHELGHSAQVNIFPNPAQDYFVLRTETVDILGYELLTVSGQRVVAQSSAGKTVQVPTVLLTNGTYLVKVITREGEAVKRIVIHR